MAKRVAPQPAGDPSTGLSNHHPQSISELLQSSETASNADSCEHGGGWDDADFSGLNDPEALRRFLGNCDYLLEASDSDNGDYDPTRECFMCEVQLEEEDDQSSASRRVPMPPPRGPMVPPAEQPQFQLEQLQELERKLEEER
jgi:hypothetical protein